MSATASESEAIVFASPVSVGHVRPLMPVARRLVERGLTVVWAISGDDNEPASAWRQPLTELGVRFVDLDKAAPFHRGRTDEFSSMKLFPRLLGRANDVAAGAASEIRAALDGCRVVGGVYDYFAVWGYVAIRRLGIDNVTAVVSAFPMILDAFPSSLYADDPIYQRELATLRANGFGAFDEMPRAGVLPRDPGLRVVCFSSPHLCAAPPAGVDVLGVLREALPQISGTTPVPEEHQALVRELQGARDRGGRIVLLSMGTVVMRIFSKIGAAHVAFLKRLYSTLAAAALREGATVVASTSEMSAAELGLDEATLGAEAAGRVFAMPFVPQPLLFARGLVDVLLMHGGANTFHEVVLSGLPVLICPGFGDQGPVAEAATALGVGMRVESINYPGIDGAITIEQAAGEVLPAMLAPGVSRWKAAAERLAVLVREDNGLDRFEALLGPRLS